MQFPSSSELDAVNALLSTLAVGDEMVVSFRRVPIVSFDSGRAPTSSVPSSWCTVSPMRWSVTRFCGKL